MRLLSLLCAIATVAAAADADVKGLLVRNQRVDLQNPSEPRIHFDLVNVSGQPVVYYALCEVRPGSPRCSTSISQEFTSAPADNPQPHTGVIQPGEVRPFSHVISNHARTSANPADVRYQIEAVVFQDGTAEGNPDVLQSRIKGRNALAAAWRQWLPRLEALENGYTDEQLRTFYRDLLAARNESDLAAFGKPQRTDWETVRIQSDLIDFVRQLSTLPPGLPLAKESLAFQLRRARQQSGLTP